MSEPSAIPLIVLSPARDLAEAINGMLRRAGQPAHCTWIPALPDLGDALTQLNPELHLLRLEQPRDAHRGRWRCATSSPRRCRCCWSPPGSTRRSSPRRLALGARDVVTLTSEARLQAVVQRELRAFRTQRALDATLKSAHDARSQLDSVLQRSNDAIIQVQEGIVVDANPAWLELLGVEEGVAGQPVMDLFEESTHAALRGALAACLQGRWNDHPLRANALLADGSVAADRDDADARAARVGGRACGW